MGNCLNCIGGGQQDGSNLIHNDSDPVLSVDNSRDILRPTLPYSNLASTYHSSAQLREQQLQSLNLEINHGIGIAVGLSTGGGSSISDEEQQVRIAKRLGLIQHLPTGLFDGAKKGECVICMMELTSGEEVRYLPCMHTYHTACIDDWLLRSLTCPTCMEPVDAALINSYHPTT
ncbi:E3 ubiquitin-protein ligase RNF181 isoform X2 [Copidosoma floridanum]|uniref:E3 ubiquitin-protein ligase RNF181 isoform X2 n=1 Tax=Copidosoma floridanum TaxID=29053 RepID=UPI0006C99513|nr:E3 ubiquitin-protein ligase RNF181 isoform X2 [Copidosoma floridanum]